MDIEVEIFIQEKLLEQQLQKLHKGAAITKGEYSSEVPGYINDMEWNFYDELHRYYVHNTYHDMLKIFSGQTFSVNLVKWGQLPIFIQVANAKVAPNIFYQTMSILGLFYVHQIMQLEQLDRAIKLSRRWYTVSHWLFKPLHNIFNRKLLKLQIKQDVEDNIYIRHRRLALRDAGFHFTTDKANFTNSNQLTNNIIFPNSEIIAKFSLNMLHANEVQKVQLGILELLVKPEANGIHIWPGICPHEGASLECQHLRDNIIQCPWHGRRFHSVFLKVNAKPWRFIAFDIFMDEEFLIARRVTNKIVANQPATAAGKVE